MRVGDGGAVERDLVGAELEQQARVLLAADAAADGEGDEDLVGGALDHVVGGAAVVGRRGYVEKDELVGALGVVERRQLDRVAGVAQLDEGDAFDDAAVVDVEAGDDALGEHGSNEYTVALAAGVLVLTFACGRWLRVARFAAHRVALLRPHPS